MWPLSRWGTQVGCGYGAPTDQDLTTRWALGSQVLSPRQPGWSVPTDVPERSSGGPVRGVPSADLPWAAVIRKRTPIPHSTATPNQWAKSVVDHPSVSIRALNNFCGLADPPSRRNGAPLAAACVGTYRTVSACESSSRWCGLNIPVSGFGEHVRCATPPVFASICSP